MKPKLGQDDEGRDAHDEQARDPPEQASDGGEWRQNPKGNPLAAGHGLVHAARHKVQHRYSREPENDEAHSNPHNGKDDGEAQAEYVQAPNASFAGAGLRQMKVDNQPEK